MKKVLLLGAGRVAGPLARYLLDQPEIHLIIATRTIDKARKLIAGHPRGIARQLNVEDDNALKSEISKADSVISLLPWIHHIRVAKICLKCAKHLVTTSYVKPEMRALDAAARKKKLLFLNEIGADPGIDHISAMNVIHRVQKAGGKILSFYSYCGGLPAPENNDNPLGYKFSWSPAGVLLAADNDGRYLENGKIIDVPHEKLFQHYRFLDIPGVGTYESYVNRDALPYLDIYGIQSAQSIYRGTLRNIGHCESWDHFKKLGLLNQNLKFDFDKMSLRQVMAELIGKKGKNLIKSMSAYLKIPRHSVTLKKLEWIGLLSDIRLPIGEATPFDMFAHILLEKLAYKETERDMLVQRHEFVAQYPDGSKEKISSTLADFGISGGDSSMSRTVGLPAAIATKLILDGKINLSGVHIPVMPEIYKPVIAELEKMNIRFSEVTMRMPE